MPKAGAGLTHLALRVAAERGPLSARGETEDRPVRRAGRGGDGLTSVVGLERPEEPPVGKAALDARQRAVADAPRERVGDMLGQGVMASGVLAADRLGDRVRHAPKPLVEGDGDLVGPDEGSPEVVVLVGHGRQDFANARLDRMVLLLGLETFGEKDGDGEGQGPSSPWADSLARLGCRRRWGTCRRRPPWTEAGREHTWAVDRRSDRRPMGGPRERVIRLAADGFALDGAAGSLARRSFPVAAQDGYTLYWFNERVQLMTLRGVFASPTQRRVFLFTSIVIIGVLTALVLWLAYETPETRMGDILISFLTALVASSFFALATGLYINYCFDDPFEIASANRLLSKDIGPALVDMAKRAMEYRLMVRTGRHFRSEVLPVIVASATNNRRRVTIEAILLDFREEEVCDRYASYRRSASFDKDIWSRHYVQKEVLASVLKLIEAARDHSALLTVNLYLSARLSTFRFDGSHDEMIVTREDPTDIASRYRSSDSEFSAYLNEFGWTRDEAFKVEGWSTLGTAMSALKEAFDSWKLSPELERDALAALDEGSPYVRRF